jgi:hypothetical protein
VVFQQSKNISNDARVLKSVAQGVNFDFSEVLVQLVRPSKVTMSKEMIAVADKEVSDLLLKKHS